jgi:hypothetical protein
MRDLILKMSISTDGFGFVGGPDDGIKWVFDSDQEATARKRATQRIAEPEVLHNLNHQKS